MRGDMWQPPFTGRKVWTRRIMVGYGDGRPPVIVRQVVISGEVTHDDASCDPRD